MIKALRACLPLLACSALPPSALAAQTLSETGPETLRGLIGLSVETTLQGNRASRVDLNAQQINSFVVDRLRRGGIPLVTLDETIRTPRRSFVHVFVFVENPSSNESLGGSFRLAVGQWWCTDPADESTRVAGAPFCAVGVTWERTGVLRIEAYRLRNTWSALRPLLAQMVDDLVEDWRATH